MPTPSLAHVQLLPAVVVLEMGETVLAGLRDALLATPASRANLRVRVPR